MMKSDSAESALYSKPPMKGRGATIAPVGRFEKLNIEYEPDAYVSEDPDMPIPKVTTEVYYDTSRSIISTNDSPDAPNTTLNIYRGCEHGCIYCFARPTHEYLGMSSGLDFETKIFVKTDAPQLVREKFSSKNWEPRPMMMSAVTDCYQPLERKLQLTRKVLEVFAEFRNPVFIVTKNYLVTRDIDILKELAKYDCISVTLSITTLDKDLARVLEPRTSQPRLRLQAVKELSEAGIPVNVNMAPIIPGLTDHEIPALLEAAAKAEARSAAYNIVRLPYSVKDLFVNWLEEHEPLKKQKILNRIRSMRGGRLYDSSFDTRMKGEGFYAQEIGNLFKASKARYGLNKKYDGLTAKYFRNPADKQLSLFD